VDKEQAIGTGAIKQYILYQKERKKKRKNDEPAYSIFYFIKYKLILSTTSHQNSRLLNADY